MKKIIPAVITLSLLAAPAVLAQQSPPQNLEICCGSDSLLANIVNWMFTVILIVAAIFIIIAAFYFVTAQGDPDKVAKARNFVLYALIGVLVAFSAIGLINFVRMIVESSSGGGGGWNLWF